MVKVGPAQEVAERSLGSMWTIEVEVSSSGLAVLKPKEVILLAKDVTIKGRGHGSISVTSHRILFGQGGTIHARSLEDLQAVKVERSLFSRRPLQLVFAAKEHADELVELTFSTGSDQDTFGSSVQLALDRKCWLADVVGPTEKAPSTRVGVGVSGIVRRQELEKRQTSNLAESAFEDLQGLMAKASTVVGILERYQATLGTTDSEEEEGQMRSLLMEVGIRSPVTRNTTGGRYFESLARELADFLIRGRFLERGGGCLTLPDVFAVFNRARGIALISPEDLETAANLLSSLQLGVCLRTFDSGVVVIQSDGFDDDAQLRAMADATGKTVGISPFDVAEKRGIPLVLAKEMVRTAEQRGVLCRDEADEFLKFYPNRFDEFLRVMD